jgi:hypothetical protein
MQAHKLTGRVDIEGKLVITETVSLPPGDVEVIVLQSQEASVSQSNSELTQQERIPPTKIKFLREWFAKTQPAPADFDADEARWEALKEKHGL